MKTIDYVYRFDPKNPSTKPPPPDSEAARGSLEAGNRLFAKWMDSCRTRSLTQGDEPAYVVQCNGLEVGMPRDQGEVPKQTPFAVVLGCSDARVPTEMLFGQGFNDLFVVRVAGNVLDAACIGSIDYAVETMNQSVRVVVVLGHSGCGAVTAAVDAYLRPMKYWSKSTSSALRSIQQKLFVAVREAANGLEEAWGPEARHADNYRDALIETAVCINAAQSAFSLRGEIEMTGRWEIDVVFGVYSLSNHLVCMPSNPYGPPDGENVRLAPAPTNPREFRSLALQMAEILGRKQARGLPGTSAPPPAEDGGPSPP
ncbi:MAG: carbonic anhydrase [Isosphaeraceae bacterium]